jgi:hypothetical protein
MPAHAMRLPPAADSDTSVGKSALRGHGATADQAYRLRVGNLSISRGGALPQAGCQRSDLLQVQGQVRWDGGVGRPPAEDAQGLEVENAKLKKLLAEAMLDNVMLRDAGRQPMAASNIADRHAGLHRLGNYGQLRFSSVAKHHPADDAGNHFHLRERVGHRRMPRLILGPPAIAGVRSNRGSFHG